MKILYPHGEATKEEIEEILRFAIEGRKRVKDQILRIDSTMADVKFGYLDKAGTGTPSRRWRRTSTRPTTSGAAWRATTSTRGGRVPRGGGSNDDSSGSRGEA